MAVITVFAFYFILWWLVFFTVLPIGVRTQDEDNDVTLGTVSSAPVQPMILKKMLITTLVSAVILAVIYLVVVGFGITIKDVPFLPTFEQL
ncbi:MAG: DUF1467 family protein [Hyphomicrobiales bacterium]